MMKKTFLLGLCALALTACETPGGVQGDGASGSSGSDEFSAVEGGEFGGTGGNGEGGTETFALSDCEPDCDYPKEALDNPESLLATRMVFFEFDSDEVREEFNDVLIAHAKYLANNPEVEVRLEGHTDERGTREYNLALSERRAKSVRQFMMLYGAPSDSINVYGFGEELPLALGNSDAAYSENRRVELVYDNSLNGE